MLLHQSVGPNPRVVLFFIAEKGIDVPRRLVNLMAGENRQADYLAKNPFGGVPMLEADDGTVIAESTVICDYFEELHPEPPLIGATPEQRALTRAMIRHVDHSVIVPMANGFRSAEGLAMFKDRTFCAPEAAPGNKAYAADGLRQLDRRLANHAFLTGERFTLADITLFCFVEFAGMVGQTVDPALTHLARWRAEIAGRPAAQASANHKLGLEQAA